jgi:putative transposase
LDDAMLRACEHITQDVCADFGAELREFNGEEDHVHLLVRYPPTVTLSRPANSLKGVSSRHLRQEFTREVNRATTQGRFWSPSYLAASCGGAPLSVVAEYIQNQKRTDEAGLPPRRE